MRNIFLLLNRTFNHGVQFTSLGGMTPGRAAELEKNH